MSVEYGNNEYSAVYGRLSLDIEKEKAKKPKESIVLFLSAFGGEYIFLKSTFVCQAISLQC